MSETGAVFSDACITPEDATIARCTACGSQLVEAAALALGMVCPDAFVYTHASSWQWPKKFTQTRSTFSEWNGGTRCKTSFRCLEHMRTPAYTLAMCSALVTDRNSAFGDRLAVHAFLHHALILCISWCFCLSAECARDKSVCVGARQMRQAAPSAGEDAWNALPVSWHVCSTRRIAQALTVGDSILVQLNDLMQLSKDLMEEMHELTGAISEFFAVAKSDDVEDLRTCIRSQQYIRLVQVTRTMSETVKQWRATCYTASGYALHPSLLVHPAPIFSLRARCVKSSACV